MQNASENPNLAAAADTADPRAWRPVSDLLNLWALCDRTTCRRARACRGDARVCIADCSRLVPLDVRVWVAEMMACKRAHLTYDQALQELPPALHEAWNAWDEAARHVSARPRT